MTSTILKMAAVVPAGVLANSDLEERFGKKEIDSITRMSGIYERRVVSKGECASDLALTAAERLFHEGGVDRKQIDALLFVSQSPRLPHPRNGLRLAWKVMPAADLRHFRHQSGVQCLPL